MLYTAAAPRELHVAHSCADDMQRSASLKHRAAHASASITMRSHRFRESLYNLKVHEGSAAHLREIDEDGVALGRELALPENVLG